MPDLSIEQIVARELQSALGEVIRSKIGGYNSPLHKFVDEVVIERQQEIKALLRTAVGDAIGQEDFKREIKSAFMHTLARSMMNEFKGEIEKQANALKQQADFRARVVLAIESVVNEYAER